jgi:hypothetical protein
MMCPLLFFFKQKIGRQSHFKKLKTSPGMRAELECMIFLMPRHIRPLDPRSWAPFSPFFMLQFYTWVKKLIKKLLNTIKSMIGVTCLMG